MSTKTLVQIADEQIVERTTAASGDIQIGVNFFGLPLTPGAIAPEAMQDGIGACDESNIGFDMPIDTAFTLEDIKNDLGCTDSEGSKVMCLMALFYQITSAGTGNYIFEWDGTAETVIYRDVPKRRDRH